MVKKILFETCSNCGKKIVDDEEALLIDAHNDLIFCNEKCLREHFAPDIGALHSEQSQLRSPTDIPQSDFFKYEQYLGLLLNEPDEIWELESEEDANPMSFFIGEFLHDESPVFYVAVAYFVDDRPAFVYMHFPTNNPDLVQKYRRGELVFDGLESPPELVDEDIDEEDPAYELFRTMVENRSEVDIDVDDFPGYYDLKISTVDSPEEIWKYVDDSGNTFVIYVAHYQRNDETVAYIVVAMEDDLTEGVIPAFGFPTLDQKLLERFRLGQLVFDSSEEF